MNDSTGFSIVSDYGMMFKTIDQGENWVFDDSLANNWFGRIKFINEQVGFITAWNKIFKTNNSGMSWIEIPHGLSNYPIFNDIDFPTENIGYITVEESEVTLLKSVDGGDTWFPIEYPSSSTLKTVDFINENEGIITGGGGIIYKTNTGGVVNIPEFPDNAFNIPQLHCYPNPVRDEININNLLLGDNHLYELIFFNSAGLKCLTIDISDNTLPVKVKISELKNGLYYIAATQNNEVISTGKIVVIN